MTATKPNADQIREILAEELAKTGHKLDGFNGTRSMFWIACPDGTVRLNWLWRGISAEKIVERVRHDAKDGFDCCPRIGRM